MPLALALVFGPTGAAVSLHAAERAPVDAGVVLRSVAEVKTAADRAEQMLPVELAGVVTHPGPAGNFFLHDGVLGIHVAQSEAGKGLKPGDRVRVTGVTRRGAFAPSIEPREVIRQGAGALPEPRRVAINEIASGMHDGQWLQVEGVVCDVGFESSVPGLMLTLAVDGRRLRAMVSDAETLDLESFLDAEVRLQGVATGSFNQQRQLVEPLLRVPGPAFLALVRRPAPDPFATAEVPLSRLLAFSPALPNPHRVRIRAVVTRSLAEGVVFVRDADRGLKLKTREPAFFRPGDRIEAVGFPTMAGSSAVVENAVCRRVGQAAAPAPLRPGWTALLDGSQRANLVQVRARLVDWVADGDAVTLILQAENHLLRAMLQGAAAESALPARNSIVDVTGLCEVSDPSDAWSGGPPTVSLLIAAPTDIAVVQRAAWWTPARLGQALAGTLVLLLAAGGWLWSLRRQVRRKAAVIRQQARHAAALEERGRIARDLHDTLEQGLTALSLQLKVVELDSNDAPQQVGAGLETARQMLRQSRALAHDAIRELRTDETARGDEPLAAGLRRIAGAWQHWGVKGVTVAAETDERRLPAETERQLLRIAAEAVTNAVKHGQATAINLSLRPRAGGVRLQIDDNGRGITPASERNAPAGFGLIGMRERASAIGATLEIGARDGGGTIITVDVACAAGAPAQGSPAASAAESAPRPVIPTP